MGRTGKWIKSFLLGKKEKDKCPTTYGNTTQNSAATNDNAPIAHPPNTPKEKKRWSFRRSSATAPSGLRDMNPAEQSVTPLPGVQQQVLVVDSVSDEKKHESAMAVATAAAADAVKAAAQAAAVVIQLTAAAMERNTAIEEAAAIRIQSVFRSYLARKALCALKGLVKLQALVRGHLVRKQATTTLRCMQALVTVQARARAQRIRMADDEKSNGQKLSIPRKSTTQENRYRHSNYEGMEENIKIVEMDLGDRTSKGRHSYSNNSQTEHRISTHNASSNRGYPKPDTYSQVSPAPSALTEMSPRACSGHFEDYSYSTAQSSPQYYSSASKPDPFSFPRPDYAESSYDFPLYPSYMANTESSRAKARSQSAPKQRPDAFERQPSRRRVSVEGRNVPRAMRMQRSSSHVGSTAQRYQYPWSIKLDRSTVSLKDSECGSTSTVLTNATYCRTLVGFDVQGNRY